jgi:hypothetical protein
MDFTFRRMASRSSVAAASSTRRARWLSSAEAPEGGAMLLRRAVTRAWRARMGAETDQTTGTKLVFFGFSLLTRLNEKPFLLFTISFSPLVHYIAPMACMRTAPLAAAAAFMARAPLRSRRRGRGGSSVVAVAMMMRQQNVSIVVTTRANKCATSTSTSTSSLPRRRAMPCPRRASIHTAVSTSSTDAATSAAADDADDADDAVSDAATSSPLRAGDGTNTSGGTGAVAGDVASASAGGTTEGTGAVVWFRQDLRLHDNQAFKAAVRSASRRGGSVVCVFVWSEQEEGDGHASWRGRYKLNPLTP